MKILKKVIALFLVAAIVATSAPFGEIVSVNADSSIKTLSYEENIKGYDLWHGHDAMIATVEYKFWYGDPTLHAWNGVIEWELTDDPNVTISVVKGSNNSYDKTTLSDDGKHLTVERTSPHAGEVVVTVKYILSPYAPIGYYRPLYNSEKDNLNGIHYIIKGENEEIIAQKDFASDVLLYKLIWYNSKSEKHTLTYIADDAAGGTVPKQETYYKITEKSSDDQIIGQQYYQTATLAGNPGGLYKPGYVFIGWGRVYDTSPPDSFPSKTVTMNNDVTVQALWGSIGSTKAGDAGKIIDTVPIGPTSSTDLQNSALATVIQYDDGHCEVVLTGDGPDTRGCNGSTMPFLKKSYKDSITKISISKDCGIKNIGSYLLYNLPSVTQVDLPGIESVGSGAFSQCSSLKSINLPDCKQLITSFTPNGVGSFFGSSAFSCDTKLTSINLPVCERIDGYAFEYCSSLETLVLPKATNLAYSLVDDCDNLKEIQVPSSGYFPLQSGYHFENILVSGNPIDYELPYNRATLFVSDSCTPFGEVDKITLAPGAAGYLSNLSAIGNKETVAFDFGEYASNFVWEENTITHEPDRNLIYIGEGKRELVFSRDNEVSSNATSIGQDVFARCSSVTSVNLPNCVSIGAGAFQNSNIADISIPNCESIGDRAFYYYNGFTSIKLPKCISIGNGAFHNSSITEISFPACKTVGDDAFSYCENIETVDLPSCTSIGDCAFQYVKVRDLSLPVCESIGTKAFYDSPNLVNLYLPACTTIASQAFYRCDSIKTASFPSLVDMPDDMFFACGSLLSLSLPLVKNIPGYSLGYLSALKYLYIPSVETLYDNSFVNMTSLKYVYLNENATFGDATKVFNPSIKNNDLTLYYNNPTNAAILQGYEPFESSEGNVIDGTVAMDQYWGMFRQNVIDSGQPDPGESPLSSNEESLISSIQSCFVEIGDFVKSLFINDVYASGLTVPDVDIDAGEYQEGDIFPYFITIEPDSLYAKGFGGIAELKDVIPDGLTFVPDSFELLNLNDTALPSYYKSYVIAGPTFEDNTVSMKVQYSPYFFNVKLKFKVKANDLPEGVTSKQVINSATINFDGYTKTTNRVINYIGARPDETVPSHDVTYAITGIQGTPEEIAAITEPLNSENIYEGTVVNLAPLPVVPGYKAVGWTTEDIEMEPTDNKFLMPDKDVAFTAGYESIPKHTVTYEVTGDIPPSYTAPLSQEYFEGAYLTSPPRESYTGYKFVGWKVSGGKIVGNKVLVGDKDIVCTAEWQKIKYTITYSLNFSWSTPSSFVPPVLEKESVEYGDFHQLQDIPQIKNFTHDAHWTSADTDLSGDTVLMPNKNITVVVNYDYVPPFKVEFYDVDENLISSTGYTGLTVDDIENGDIPELPDIDNYIPLGWVQKDIDGYVSPETTLVESSPGSKVVKLYAKYRKNVDVAADGIPVVKKIIINNKDDSIPCNFDFKIEALSYTGAAGLTKDTMPKPTNKTLSIDKSEWGTINALPGSDNTFTKEKEILAESGINPGIVFIEPGKYVYRVYEDPTISSSALIYSGEEYEIEYSVEFANDGDDKLSITSVVVSKTNDFEGNTISPPSEEETITFTNKYLLSDFILSKNVEGSAADYTQSFSFIVKIDGEGTKSGQVYNSDGTKSGGVISSSAGSDADVGKEIFNISLKNGQYLKVSELPPETKIHSEEVLNDSSLSYTASSIITVGGVPGEKTVFKNATDTEPAENRIAVLQTSAIGENKAAFTNSYSISPDTGVRDTMIFESMLMLLAVAFILVIAFRKKPVSVR